MSATPADFIAASKKYVEVSSEVRGTLQEKAELLRDEMSLRATAADVVYGMFAFNRVLNPDDVHFELWSRHQFDMKDLERLIYWAETYFEEVTGVSVNFIPVDKNLLTFKMQIKPNIIYLVFISK